MIVIGIEGLIIIAIVVLIAVSMLVYRSSISNKLYILHKNNMMTVHTLKKNAISENEENDTVDIKFGNKDTQHVVLPTKAIFTYEKRVFGIPKISKIIILRGNENIPVLYEEMPLSAKTKLLIQSMRSIVNSHILGEWLYVNKKLTFMYIIMLVLGFAMGLVLGFVLFPHLFATTVQTSAHATNSTLR
ncbi:MAG: hypothetical protein QXI16_00225 [Sulfolobaceae archaeon]